VLKEAIHQFKFQQKLKLGPHLAQLLISQLTNHVDLNDYQSILPVPLHKTRQKQRGYNQSTILAKYLAHHYHLPLILNNLIRIRPTDSQSLLQGHQERQKNVKNAFRVKVPASIQDQSLILLDDVFTTGATVNECAKTLKQAGAKSVLVLTVSRADIQQHLSP
jgi:ComF family protein